MMSDDRGTQERSTADSQAATADSQAATADGQAATADGQAATADGQAPDQAPAPGAPAPAKARSLWRELPVLIVVALVIALVIKSFVVQAFYIPSSSMENTLEIGDKVLVNKLVYHFRDIQPGDIIVFNGAGSWDAARPAANSANPLVRVYDATLVALFHSVTGLFGTAPGQFDYIKRVIGVPGDHLACCSTHGDVTVNGVALQESSYLYPGDRPSQTPPWHVTVPAGRLWVMGDHRSVSWDSRGHTQFPGGGTIPEDEVVGRAFVIVWPPSRLRILPIPSTFGQPGIDAPGPAAAGPSSLTAAGISVAARPAAPYLPIGAGFAGAVPLTWLQHRLRRRPRRRNP